MVTLQKIDVRDEQYGVTTDPGGHFLLQNLPLGRYRLSVEHSGYVRQEYGQDGARRSATVLTLEGGCQLLDLRFRLIRTAVVSGRVLDEDREALPGAQVQAVRYRYVGAREQLVFAAGASANDLGEFRLFGLAPGRYYLVASHRPGTAFDSSQVAARPSPSDLRESYPQTYFPGVSDPSQATSIEIKAGDLVEGTEFVLRPVRTVRLRGRVLNALTGRAANGATVSLTPRERSYSFFQNEIGISTEDGRGDFELGGVIPGSYRLNALWTSDGKTYSTSQFLDVGDKDVLDINLLAGPGIDLGGRVLIEGGAKPSLKSLCIRLQPTQITETTVAGASVESDGTFAFHDVPADIYYLSAVGLPPDVYLKQATFAGANVLEKSLIVNKDKEVGRLEIVLSPTAGLINGQVLTQENLPASGSIVLLIPDQPRRDQSWFRKRATTDPAGRFTIRGIAPGDYRLLAWSDTDSDLYEDPNFLRLCESTGEWVHIDAGGRVTANLQLPPQR